MIVEECAGAVVEEASTGRAVLDAVRRQNWAVVILDINLPDKNISMTTPPSGDGEVLDIKHGRGHTVAAVSDVNPAAADT